MKAYIILDLSIHDMGSFAQYIEEIPAHIQRHGGRYIVQGSVPESVEGSWTPERVVVLEFPSKEVAKGFLADPTIQPLFELRHRSTHSQTILVESGQQD